MERITVWLAALILVLGICCCAGAEGLPAWKYTGEDPIEKAAAEYTVERGKDFLNTETSVCIPEPVIIRVDKTDDTHATVYGNFWISVYELKDDVLECISGGECPAVMQMTLQDGVWTVTGFEQTGEGEEYASGIRDFCKGDKDLEKAYFESADQDVIQSIRVRFVGDYVKANNLNVKAYKDYGWDPVPLFAE